MAGAMPAYTLDTDDNECMSCCVELMNKQHDKAFQQCMNPARSILMSAGSLLAAAAHLSATAHVK